MWTRLYIIHKFSLVDSNVFFLFSFDVTSTTSSPLPFLCSSHLLLWSSPSPNFPLLWFSSYPFWPPQLFLLVFAPVSELIDVSVLYGGDTRSLLHRPASSLDLAALYRQTKSSFLVLTLAHKQTISFLPISGCLTSRLMRYQPRTQPVLGPTLTPAAHFKHHH